MIQITEFSSDRPLFIPLGRISDFWLKSVIWFIHNPGLGKITLTWVIWSELFENISTRMVHLSKICEKKDGSELSEPTSDPMYIGKAFTVRKRVALLIPLCSSRYHFPFQKSRLSWLTEGQPTSIHRRLTSHHLLRQQIYIHWSNFLECEIPERSLSRN